MAHFAKIENNIVTNIIVVNNKDCNGGDFPESESFGQKYIFDCGLDGFWVQCSYNNNFRRKYPNIGDFYCKENNLFYSPQPFLSWKLNENFEWYPPKKYPYDGKDYWWDEEEQEWIAFDDPTI